MGRLTGFVLGCVVAAASAGSAGAQECRGTVTAAEAAAAEDARYAALMKDDIAALEKLLGADLVYSHSTAVVDDKKAFIASLRSGVRYRSMKRSDVSIRTYGCVAILTGRADFVVSNKGQESPAALRFHSVWAKRDGGLQFVSWQSTRLPAP